MQTGAILCGLDGELVMVRVVVDGRELEETLETLAQLDFPVNPELFHRGQETTIEFPAYVGKLDEIGRVLRETEWGVSSGLAAAFSSHLPA